MARYACGMDGSGPYEVVVYTSASGTTVSTSLYWQRVGSVGYSSWSGGASFNVTIAGYSVASGGYSFNAPSGGSIGEQWIGGGSLNVGAVGSVNCAGYFNSDTSGAGYGQCGGPQSVATTPPAPSNVAGTPDQATSTGMRYQFSGNGDGGSGIIRWEYECWPSGGAPTGVGTSSGTTVRNDLLPGTTWNWHSRGVNALGAGGWSATVSRDTLAASAPSMNVAPSLQGTSATLTPVPDASMPTVNTWLVERRTAGTTTPVTPYTFTTPTYSVTGLAQGTVYEWRVAAKSTQNGVSYTSPYSNWVAVQQPNPNTNPGTYFDGSTTSTTDVTYSWDGATSNSPSRATMKDVLGWTVSAGASGANVVLVRQGGGRSQAQSARLLVLADATAAGVDVGMSLAGRADVSPGGVYWGSVFTQIPARGQRFVGSLRWLTAAGALISTTTGTPVVVAANPGSWDRIVVSGTAPAGAAKAELHVADVTGTGWAAWVGGDVAVFDDAMIALGLYDYFDGNTMSTPSARYEWLGATNASASAAYPLNPDDDDPLADPDCPPAPIAPLPPQIDDECIDEVGTWRRYWAIIPREEVRQWLTIVPTLYLTTGGVPARQVRIRVYANPDQLPPDQYVPTEYEAEQIISYMPANTTLTIDGVSQRVWASVGGADPIAADKLLYGTGGAPATWPLLRCGTAYLLAFDVPLDAPDGNLTTQVSLTTRAM